MRMYYSMKNYHVFYICSDIPPGEKDLDDAISFKEKIKALDNKLIIQPSPDKRKSQLSPDQPNNRFSQHSMDVVFKRRSQNEVNMADSIIGLVSILKAFVCSPPQSIRIITTIRFSNIFFGALHLLQGYTV